MHGVTHNLLLTKGDPRGPTGRTNSLSTFFQGEPEQPGRAASGVCVPRRGCLPHMWPAALSVAACLAPVHITCLINRRLTNLHPPPCRHHTRGLSSRPCSTTCDHPTSLVLFLVPHDTPHKPPYFFTVLLSGVQCRPPSDQNT